MTTIPGDHTSPERVAVGGTYIGFTSPGSEFFDRDAIGVDLLAGQTYRITLTPENSGTTSDFDTRIGDILNASGASLGFSDDDSAAGLAAMLLFTPAANGTYFVVVSPNFSGDLGGSWALSVEEFTAPADDFSNDLDPSNPIAIWETQDGHIGSNGDTDTIALSLEAGVAVDITVYGNDIGFFGEIDDIEIVTFVDASGDPVDPMLIETAAAEGTFTAGGPFDAHQITFTPDSTGIYYITIGAGAGETVGDYSVSVSAHDRGAYSIRASEIFTLTGNAEIDIFFTYTDPTAPEPIFLDRDGDGVTTLTYSIPGAVAATSPGVQNAVASEWNIGYVPASGVVLDAFLTNIAHIELLTNIQFVQVDDAGVEAGTFRIGDTDIELGSASGALVTGWSGFPGWTMAGETWVNVDKGEENAEIFRNFGAAGLSTDNFLYNRTLHEFTHNLGLLHPDFSALASVVDFKLLGGEYSIMSRSGFRALGVDALPDLFPQTLMWLDIQALQAAYGVNTTTLGGDTIYALQNTDRIFATIWDYGGNDTLNLPGTSDLSINLTPGSWIDVGTDISYYSLTDGSLIGVNHRTLFIAPDTVIENMDAGSGNDFLAGNSANNEIRGNAGFDTLAGGAGQDLLYGGDGNDQLFGGAEGDHLSAGFGSDTLAGGEGDDYLEGGNGTDELYGGSGADTLDGGPGSDLLTGNAGNDFVDGGISDDTVLGGDGNDTVLGGDGNDNISGTRGFDEVYGGAGSDTAVGGNDDDLVHGDDGNDLVAGTRGDDTVHGDAGNDTVLGGDGDDLLFGGTENDELYGGNGTDTLNGGTGDDLLAGSNGNDLLNGEGGNDTLFGGAGLDTLSGGDGADQLFGNVDNDELYGDAGNDTLNGGGGDDLLNGGADNDVLLGDVGNDTLIGGTGDDEINGGGGDDRFEYAMGDGDDLINGFNAGEASDDVIFISGFGAAFDEFADILANASDDGTDTTIILGAGSITLNGVLVADLHQDDFLF